MPWLTVDYHPGFAEDLTSWHIEIERDGRFRQSVQICRFDPYEKRTEQHETKLAPEQITGLERLIVAADFAVVVSAFKGLCVDDAELIHISVDGPLARSISAPLLVWHGMQQRGEVPLCPPLNDTIRLWRAINHVSPHKRVD